jgi:hypothetical protein
LKTLKAAPTYPFEEGPCIDILVGDLSLLEFTSSMRRSFSEMLRLCIEENEGSVCGFACAQGMASWLQGGPDVWLSRSNGPDIEHKPVYMTEDKEVSDSHECALESMSEEEQCEIICRVTQEAFTVAAAMRAKDSSKIHNFHNH